MVLRPLPLLCLLSALSPARAQEPAPPASFVAESVKLLQAQGHALEEPARRAAVLLALARVADPAAEVTDAAGRAAREELERGVRYRPGIRFAATNDTVQVIELLPGTPAVAAGVPVSSTLAAVDGVPVASNRLSAVLQSLRREQAGRVKLDFRTRDGQAKAVEIPLAPLPEPSVDLTELLPGGFGYLKLNGLHGDAGDWVSRVILRWEQEKVAGLILDLRDAGGSDLPAVARIAGLFAAPDAPVFTTQPRAGGAAAPTAAPPGPRATMPVLVLLNGGTRGAAELLAAALEHGARGAMLVGAPTAGDPLVREFVPAPGGLLVRLATRVHTFPDGHRLDGSSPLQPEIRVADANLPPPPSATALDWELMAGEKPRNPDPDALARAARVGRDAVLQRAVDILLGLKALNIRAASPVPAPAHP